MAAGERLRGDRPRSAAASSRDEIEDYYFTPWDLGYGNYVKFDHDFIGRDALERMADGDHRQKVTLALDDEDVTRTIGSMFRKTGRAKFIDWPSAVYAMHPFDRVTVDGETVGVSTWVGYSANEGKMLTLAVLDAEHAEPGTEVTFVWGEEDGGTAKPTVEPHVADGDRRRGQPGPVRRGGAEVVRAGQLARRARMTQRIPDCKRRQRMSTAPQSSLSIGHPHAFFVGGRWIEPSSGDELPVISPSTEDVVMTFAEAKEADVDRAVAAAREAFDTGPWPRLSAAERAGCLRKVAAALTARHGELAEAWTTQVGAPISFTSTRRVSAQGCSSSMRA